MDKLWFDAKSIFEGKFMSVQPDKPKKRDPKEPLLVKCGEFDINLFNVCQDNISFDELMNNLQNEFDTWGGYCDKLEFEHTKVKLHYCQDSYWGDECKLTIKCYRHETEDEIQKRLEKNIREREKAQKRREAARKAKETKDRKEYERLRRKFRDSNGN